MILDKLLPVRKIKNLKDMLTQSVMLFKEKNAFVFREGNEIREIKYSQFGKDVNALGTALIDMGLKDSKIAIISENRYEWCLSYLAIVNGVGVVLPLDNELSDKEFLNILNQTKTEAIIFSEKLKDKIIRNIDKLPILKYFIDMDSDDKKSDFFSFANLVKKGEKSIKKGNNSYIDAKIDPYSMSILIYTSGTTDFAKGVMLSHRNICSNLTAVCSTIHFSNEDSTVAILPLYHTYSCMAGFLTIIYNGGSLSFCQDSKNISKCMRELNPTILVAVPSMLEGVYRKTWNKIENKKWTKIKINSAIFLTNLLNKILTVDIRRKVFKAVHESFGGEIRLIILGAAPVRPEVSKFFRKIGINVLQGYGLTECSPIVTANRERFFNDSSCGLPLPGVQVMIYKPNHKGVGEVLVKGENVMLGYYENDDATGGMVRDGWLHTGDLGKFDKKGFLYIRGRLTNTIVKKDGKKVAPEEIEARLNSYSIIRECLVCGKYDKESGTTEICAQIFPDYGYLKERFQFDESKKEETVKLIDEIISNINNETSEHKKINSYIVRDVPFKKTTTQKIMRYIEDPMQEKIDLSEKKDKTNKIKKKKK